MRTLPFVLFLFLSSFIGRAQDITGQWNGVLKFQGTQLRLVFNISKSEKGYSSTMDSPDQGAKGIPVTATTFENSKLKIEIANAGITYGGELKENEVQGTFKQGGMEFPLNLSRKAIEKEALKRPQEPVKPYPYVTEDVVIQNPQASISLAGTLSLPEKGSNFPVAVLISGSGPQNRDEELLGHKPFLIIADYLTRHGIAVLRFDDRGVGQSKGEFKTATSADFATDVESAVAYLKTRKEIDPKKIGLIGHSEGGIIAPMVASRSKDVNFIVLLAGTGIRGDKLLLIQQELIARANGVSEAEIKKSLESGSIAFDMVLKSKDIPSLTTDLTRYIKDVLSKDKTAELPKGMTEEQFISSQINQLTSPWMVYFIKYDPAIALEKVKCSVLAVNGEKDLQVPPKENLTAIENALKKGKNKNVTIKEFPNLNHLFQEAKTGSPSEYAAIEQTFAPVALEEVTQWILSKTK
ncbi:alpha/beta fold hydrolase [Emticicia sp. CRIBPO]|uniref:alpha/beta hydrolase family protein n=1 Tax=Emticicia sp. CRIBPO TaxID=2683258 RepID=UPI001411B8DF|nr:alpha/beta fold hydrolase [Emticicia sp. CRIBPO]NBA86675.1 alpha/beta fold hydrolase [Emticicia sp. CRIBPO]